MANMKTLTINGQKFVVDDENAVQIPETAPAKGTVPTSDGEGGTTWETGTLYITVTGNASDGYTADKTIDELLDAYEKGKHLACILVESNTRNLYGLHAVNIVARQVTFQRLVAYPNTKSPVQRIGITNLGVTVSNQYMLPGDAESGQVLTYSGGLLKWAPIPDELPTTGTDGQVLTLVSGSPAWADASGGGAGVMYVTTTANSADKTIDEIIEAYNAGYIIVAISMLTDTTAALLPLIAIDTTNKIASFALSAISSYEDGTEEAMLITVGITADGVTGGTNETSHSLPTGGTAGQVLTIGSDGSPVWADPVATSAEGVEFG